MDATTGAERIGRSADAQVGRHIRNATLRDELSETSAHLVLQSRIRERASGQEAVVWVRHVMLADGRYGFVYGLNAGSDFPKWRGTLDAMETVLGTPS